MFSVARQSGNYRRKECVLGVSVDEMHKAYPFRDLKKASSDENADVFAGRRLTIVWSEAENAAYVRGASGQDVPSVLAYWFAWYAFHPDTEVFR